jgi:hypothetical protein
MRIEIRKNGKAVIISFGTRTERFESPTERNRFFRGLYGWEQVVPGERKSYHYRRPGLLDDVPHMKISDSVFMVAANHMKRVAEYFEQWNEKVEFEMLEVMLENQRIMRELCARKNDAMPEGRLARLQKGRRIEIEGE